MRRNRFRKIIVEFLRNIAGEFEMLLLVFANRHMRCAINENVGCHQHRIIIQADGRILAILAGFFLELRHAVQPANARYAIEHPRKLGMFGHLALVEDDVFLRIDATGDEGRCHFADIGDKLLGVMRLRDRVHIDDAIDALMALLQLDEFDDGAEIIPEMEIAGRLNAGKHQFFESHFEIPRALGLAGVMATTGPRCKRSGAFQVRETDRAGQQCKNEEQADPARDEEREGESATEQGHPTRKEGRSPARGRPEQEPHGRGRNQPAQEFEERGGVRLPPALPGERDPEHQGLRNAADPGGDGDARHPIMLAQHEGRPCRDKRGHKHSRYGWPRPLLCEEGLRKHPRRRSEGQEDREPNQGGDGGVSIGDRERAMLEENVDDRPRHDRQADGSWARQQERPIQTALDLIMQAVARFRERGKVRHRDNRNGCSDKAKRQLRNTISIMQLRHRARQA